MLCTQHRLCIWAEILCCAFAGPEAAGQAEQATALLLSRAIEVLCPADVWAAAACTAPAAARPGTACRRLLTDDGEVVQECQSHPESGQHLEAEAGEGREAGSMESDPLLAEALERLVSLAVGCALFGAGEAGSEAGDSTCPSCRATPRGEEESLRAVLYEEHGREEGVFCVVMALDTPRTKASKVAAAAAAVLGQQSPRHCLRMEAASLCL